MITDFVLIDYENVQPKELALLHGSGFKVKLFIGANQPRIPVVLASTLHALGSDAEYVLLEASGTNALDFHIAYTIGVLSNQDPAARFHIISKDSGFDPLINHLKLRGIVAQRLASIAGLAPAKPKGSVAADQVQLAIDHLGKMKAAKPRTEKTLRSTLHALFKKSLDEERMSALLAALCARGVVNLEGKRVTYAVGPEP